MEKENNLIVLKRIDYNSNSEEIIICEKDMFEWTADSDTYDGCGQTISHADAGDYIELNIDFTDEDGDIYNANTIINAYDNPVLFDEIIEKLEEDKDYTLNKPSGGMAHNFWNGQNWKTIWLSHDCYDSFITIEKVNKTIEKDILDDLENAEYSHEETGYRYYKGEKYMFIESAFPTEYAKYIVEKLEEENKK